MKYTPFLCLFMLVTACSTPRSENQNSEKRGEFGSDLDFLTEHLEVIKLSSEANENAQLLIVPQYQGRVMTSTTGGESGKSYGWINYDLIASGKLTPHMNAFGGEERIWLSPEGGQYSVFFPPGSTFSFENWQTPAFIDSEPYHVVSFDDHSASFTKKTSFENYSGTTFDIQIDRTIRVLRDTGLLGISAGQTRWVGYQSENIITNLGEDWDKEKGTVGIWILGMFKPSDATTLLAPYNPAIEPIHITDDYFGKVPADRLLKTDSLFLFKGDGKQRGKIGLAPPSAKPLAGAYDAENHVLTIICFDYNPQGEYLKSTWEFHDQPYSGDAFNSYNDGKTEDGSQLGPFIELESNSPTLALKKGEKLTHKHSTFHFEGPENELDKIARQVLGISLDRITSQMK